MAFFLTPRRISIYPPKSVFKLLCTKKTKIVSTKFVFFPSLFFRRVTRVFVLR